MRMSDWSSDVCSSDLAFGPELSRRPLHGRDLQRAALARPDLELCRQQLSARQRLSALRPALLERRRHKPARKMAPAISGRSLSRQSAGRPEQPVGVRRSEEHTSELQSLMRISYAVFCLKKKKNQSTIY